MTRVIRNAQGLYFKSNGEWTKSFEEAHRFENMQSALSERSRLHLQKIELVIVVHDKPSPEWDVVLPLGVQIRKPG